MYLLDCLADHSPPSSAKVKNEWCCASVLPMPCAGQLHFCKQSLCGAIMVKVKVTLVQALRLCTGHMAHRGSRGIAIPFHDHGTRRG